MNWDTLNKAIAMSASQMSDLATENAESILNAARTLEENTDDEKNCVLRLTHTIGIDLDTLKVDNCLSWSVRYKVEASGRVGDPNQPELDYGEGGEE